MIKKAICLLAFILLLSLLTACGDTNSTTTDVADSSAAVETPTEDKQVAVETPSPEPTPTPEEVIEEALTEGRNYYYGLNGVTADNDKALEAFQKAADLDSAEAYYYIGGIHSRAEEYDESIKSLEKAIELGNSMAKLALGDYYHFGQGVEKDNVKAKELFEAAVNEGCIESNVGLGWIYLTGDGVDADVSKAIEYFELATSGTELDWICEAYRNLRDIYTGYYDEKYKDENKVDENVAKVEELSSSWDPDYTGYNGLAYETIGNYDKALEWYQKADTSLSLYQIGWWYANGANGFKQDNTKARGYFEKAAGLGNAGAMEWIAYYYQNGIDVEKNIDTAMEWYEKSGSAGSGNAYNEIGKLYYFGEDVEQDYSKALDYFLKGSDLKDTNAMLDAGMCYRDGYGTDVDYEKACEYYAKADYYGDKSGGDSILDLLNAGKIDEATANKWMDFYYK